MDQINDIAGPGNEDNIFLDAITKGFAALDQDFAVQITKDVCKDPCKHVIDEVRTQSLIEQFKNVIG